MATPFSIVGNINLKTPNLKAVAEEIRSTISGLNGQIKIELSKNAATNLASINKEVKTLDANLTAVASSSNAAATALDRFSSSLSTIKGSAPAVAAVDKELKKVAVSASTTGTAMNSVAAASKNVSSGALSFQQVGVAAGTAAKQINVAHGAVFEFGRQSALAGRRFLAFTVAAGSLFALIRVLEQGFGAALKFEEEMRKLSQVTLRSRAGLIGIEQEIRRLSTTLGVSSQSLSEVSVTLAQAGFSARDTKIALEALAKTELAPTFKDLKNTTEGLIAIRSQFKLTASEFEQALSIIDRVAADFAIEADDIVTAVQKFGGVFAIAGGEIDKNGIQRLQEFAAVLTSVRATTRESADTIATGLRTIGGRLQRAGTQKALEKFNITLTETKNNGEVVFVGIEEALSRLSKGLSGVSSNSREFAAIIEEIGGLRQLSKVIPAIKQFGLNQKALNSAKDAGNSLDENTIEAQKTLTNQLSRLKETFLDVIASINKPGALRTFIELMIAGTKQAVIFAKALTPLLPLLIGKAGLNIFKSIPQFTQGFKSELQKGAQLETQRLTLELNKHGIITSKDILSTDGNTASTNANTQALAANTASNVVKSTGGNAAAIAAFNNAMFGPSSNKATTSGGGGINPALLSRLDRARAKGGGKLDLSSRRANLNRNFPLGGTFPVGASSSVPLTNAEKIAQARINRILSGNLGPTGPRIGRAREATALRKELQQDRARRLEQRRDEARVQRGLPPIGGNVRTTEQLRNQIERRRRVEEAKVLREELRKERASRIISPAPPGNRDFGRLPPSALSNAEKQRIIFSGALNKLPTGSTPTSNINNLGVLNRLSSGPVGRTALLRESLGANNLLGKFQNPVPKVGLLGGLRFNKDSINRVSPGLALGGAIAGGFISSKAQESKSGVVNVGGQGVGSALAGAGIGSLFGPQGIAIGAVVGGFLSLVDAMERFKDKLLDTKLEDFNKEFERQRGSFEKREKTLDEFINKLNFDENPEELFKRQIDSGFAFGRQQELVGTKVDLRGITTKPEALTSTFVTAIEQQNAFLDQLQARTIGGGAKELAENTVRSIAKERQSQFGKQREDILDAIKLGFQRGDKLSPQRIEKISSVVGFTQENKLRVTLLLLLNKEEEAKKLLLESTKKQIDAIKAVTDEELTLNNVIKDLRNEFDGISAKLSTFSDAVNVAAERTKASEEINDRILSNLGGSTKSGSASNRISTVLSNRGAFGEKALLDAFKSLDQLSGIEGISKTFESVIKLEKNLPVASQLARENTSKASPKEVVNSFIESLGLSDNVAGGFGAELNKILKDDLKNDIGLDELESLLSKIAPEVQKTILDVSIDFAKKIEGAAQNYVNALDKSVDLQLQANERLDRTSELRAGAGIERATRFGGEASLESRLAEARSRFGSIRGAGPAGIASQLRNAINTRDSLEKEKSGISPTNRDEFIRVSNSIRDANLKVREFSAALELLATDTKEAAVLQDELNKVNQRRDSTRGFLQGIIGGGPEGLLELQRQVSAVSAFKSGDDRVFALAGKELIEGVKLFADRLRDAGKEEQAAKLESELIERFTKLTGAPEGALGGLLKLAGTARGKSPEETALSSKLDEVQNRQIEASRLLGEAAQKISTDFVSGSLNTFQTAFSGIKDVVDMRMQEILAAVKDNLQRGKDKDPAKAMLEEGLKLDFGSKAYIDFMKRFSGLRPTGEGNAGSRPQGLANGGYLRGGSGTKDDVPIMAMGGEFIVKKSQAQKHKDLLEAINSGKMSGYANGGFVRRRGALGTTPEAVKRRSGFDEARELAIQLNRQLGLPDGAGDAERKQAVFEARFNLRPAGESKPEALNPRLSAARNRIASAQGRSDSANQGRLNIAKDRIELARRGRLGGFNGLGDGAIKRVGGFDTAGDRALDANRRLGLTGEATLEERAAAAKSRLGGRKLSGLTSDGPLRLGVGPAIGVRTEEERKILAKRERSKFLSSFDEVTGSRKELAKIAAEQRFAASPVVQRRAAARANFEANKAAKKAAFEGRFGGVPVRVPAIAPVAAPIAKAPTTRLGILSAREDKERAARAARVEKRLSGRVPLSPEDALIKLIESPRILKPTPNKDARARVLESRRDREGFKVFKAPASEPEKETILDKKIELLKLEKNISTRNAGELRAKASSLRKGDSPKSSISEEDEFKKRFPFLSESSSGGVLNFINRLKNAKGFANGGYVSGKDTIPAMLSRGEYVVNSDSAKNNLGLLHNINKDKVKKFQNGGVVGGSSGGSSSLQVDSRVVESLNNFSKSAIQLSNALNQLRDLKIPERIEITGNIQTTMNLVGGTQIASDLKQAIVNAAKTIMNDFLNEKLSKQFNPLTGEPITGN